MPSPPQLTNLRTLLERLEKVPDWQLTKGLEEYRLSIADEKYETAFSCMSMAYWIQTFRDTTPYKPAHVPSPPGVARIHHQASLVMMLFVTLLFMRSEHLERGLDRVEADSPLRPFRDILRSGSPKRGEDTTTQHLRNALAHGTFRFSPHCAEVHFEDRDWLADISVSDLEKLCGQVHRLYDLAFQVHDQSR